MTTESGWPAGFKPMTWEEVANSSIPNVEHAIHRLREFMIQKPNVRFDARDKMALRIVLTYLAEHPPTETK